MHDISARMTGWFCSLFIRYCCALVCVCACICRHVCLSADCAPLLWIPNDIPLAYSDLIWVQLDTVASQILLVDMLWAGGRRWSKANQRRAERGRQRGGEATQRQWTQLCVCIRPEFRRGQTRTLAALRLATVFPREAARRERREWILTWLFFFFFALFLWFDPREKEMCS